MKSTSFSILKSFAVLGGLAFPVGSSLAADTDSAPPSPTYDRPAIEIGGGISNDGGTGDVNFIVPMIFSDGKDLLFFGADVKFSGFDVNDTDDTVFNAGGYLGYRRLLDDGAGVFGLWAGVDYFNTNESNEFARAIAGVEYFGPSVIARANAFVPFDSTSAEWTVTSGGFINTYDEKVPSGFDAEVGLRMPVAMDSFVKPGEFRIFAGAYDFIGLDDNGGDVLGGRARAELDLYPFDAHPDTRLSFEAMYAYDKHSGDQYGAGVKLSIPLGVTNKVTSHGAKDDVVAELDSFGQDLFQPVRRNRENVSRVKLKDRQPVDTGTGGIGGVTMSNVCGGASGSLSLNSGLGATSIKQGSQIGIIDPTGAASPLNLSLGNMVDSSGKSLTQLLASKPQTINTTLSFPTSTVNFASQQVQPSAAVASTGSAATSQKIASATVTINGNSCSMNVETAASSTGTGISLSTVCGGPNASIPLNTGLVAASVKQGAILGNVITLGVNSGDLVFAPATMIDQNGSTLEQLLANQPQKLIALLTLPSNAWDPLESYIAPLSPYIPTAAVTPGCSRALSSIGLIVKNNVCSLNINFTEACVAAKK